MPSDRSGLDVGIEAALVSASTRVASPGGCGGAVAWRTGLQARRPIGQVLTWGSRLQLAVPTRGFCLRSLRGHADCARTAGCVSSLPWRCTWACRKHRCGGTRCRPECTQEWRTCHGMCIDFSRGTARQSSSCWTRGASHPLAVPAWPARSHLEPPCAVPRLTNLACWSLRSVLIPCWRTGGCPTSHAVPRLRSKR